jgi:hypothetical protein
MSGTRLYAHWFKDPTGDVTKDVFAEVECTSVRSYPGSSEEPADYDVHIVRLSLNDRDFYGQQLRAPRVMKVAEHVLEQAR